ncbi:MAG: PD-(D/E)XK nuclease family protein [Pirellulales bacterium]|nr:PD-(D/E)XK nuclease family protein [Alphaproteobacteria bacterium]MDA8042226.1 PD-(D/E)XK nuclease family protein [Pirellulales bacterium]
MQNFSDERFSDFFEKFRLLKEKHDAVAAATGARFNIFSVLGREYDEVQTHSRFLAELLNPKGSHLRGTVFLRLFFGMLRKKNFPQKLPEIMDGELKFFDVSAEAGTGDLGRIDILIENREKCIVIENKIYAGDQERQLGRYYDYAKGKFGNDENFAVVYLTLDGHAPSDYTLYGESPPCGETISKEKVLCISYSKDVIGWVAACVKESAPVPHIRETLFQYQRLLEKLTDQTTDQDSLMDFNQLLSENRAIISELEEAIQKFKSHALFVFWDALKTRLDATKKEVRYVARDTKGPLKIRDSKQSFKRALEKNVDRYIGMGAERGILALSLEKIDDAHTLCLSIAQYKGRPFYGFAIVRESDEAFLRSAEERKEIRNFDFNRYADRARDAVEKAINVVECGWGRGREKETQELALGEAFPGGTGSFLGNFLKAPDEDFFDRTLDEKKRSETVELIGGQVAEIVRAFCREQK